MTVRAVARGVQLLSRDRVPALTGVLTVVSLALVFGAVLRVVPVGALPRSAALVAAVPHVNAGVSLLAIGTISAGWYWIRSGDVRKHRAAMAASFLLFVAFLALYLYRVSLEGPTSFPGPPAVETYVYYPTLAVHVLLAIVCVPLLYYVLLLAATHPVRELPRTDHARVGRIAASLWLISFALGVVVYALLYVVY
jgi:putative membrane protein